MIKLEDISVGKKLWILNAKNFKMYEDTIESIEQKTQLHTWKLVKMSKFKYPLLDDSFCKAVDPVRNERNYMPNIQFKGTSTTYFLFTSEDKALELLNTYLLPIRLKELIVETDLSRKRYFQLVDEVGKMEKRIEQEKEKYAKRVTQK